MDSGPEFSDLGSSGGPDEPHPDGDGFGGDPGVAAAVDSHVEAHIGPISWVSHELIAEIPRIDVHYVPAGPDRPFQTFVTSGMSEWPMNTNGEVEGDRFAELMAVLPPDWPVSDEALADERHYWPVGLLKAIARFPRENDTWLGAGHSIPNGDPPAPLAEGTAFCAILLLPSVLLPPSVHRLTMPSGKTVDFLCIVPLYAEELELKVDKGTAALLDLFDEHGLNEMIQRDRVNVARRGWRFPWRRT